MTQPDNTQHLVEHSFQTEAMRSEKLRVTLLSAFFIVCAIWVYAQGGLQAFPIAGYYLGIPFYAWLSGTAAVFALYEFIVSRVLNYYIVTGRPFPIKALYMNALVETSIPSVIIFIMSKIVSLNALFVPSVFFYFIFISFSVLRLNYRLSIFTGTVAAAGYLTVAVIILTQNASAVSDAPIYAIPLHINKALIIFVVGLVASFVAARIKKHIVSSYQLIDERNRIEKMFGQHVSPAVVERLLSQPREMESELRHVCVMFLDIRKFTSFADKNTPEAVVDYLNALFNFMIDIINENYGVINKFLGDGFMAVFGAPFSDGYDSHNAVQAARQIIERVNNNVASGTLPPTRIGIGLHAGEAVTGNIGSAVRREYTIIGDVVNLAPRIEGLNKTFDSQLLVSKDVWDGIKHDNQQIRELDSVEIRGVKNPITLHQLC